MVIGLLDINEEEECEGFVYGKIHQLHFPKTSWRAKAHLQLVRSDICGPVRTPSLNQKLYFIFFIDELSFLYTFPGSLVLVR